MNTEKEIQEMTIKELKDAAFNASVAVEYEKRKYELILGKLKEASELLAVDHKNHVNGCFRWEDLSESYVEMVEGGSK